MKLITRNTDYAIRALCFIAKNEKEVLPVSILVNKLNIPRPFLRKILQRLNKEGILSSYKGINGGFKLALKADKIFIYDLIEVFQGPVRFSECILKKLSCPRIRKCLFRKKIEKIEKYVMNEFKSFTLADLLD